MSAPALPEFARAWLQGRAAAAVAVEAVEHAELRGLDDEEALRLSHALLAATPTDALPEARRTSSGFVEQQRLFARARAIRR